MWQSGKSRRLPDDFEYLYQYSPLHNIKDGVDYPATIIGTADTDDRVAPHHARKFTARLQEANGGDNPIIYREESKAGHGFGKPVNKIIEEKTDFFAFIFNELKGNYFTD
ncbi:MAG: prolyl oligopeptidase family serine peptidase [Bacillota bacterium]